MLCACPVAETGFQDDWSYIRTASDFARTGHFVYHGWTTAMLGWIIPWTALFLRAFGFSFTLARATLLPVDLGCVYLFHASLVRLGIRGRAGILGGLTLGLSPVYLPLAASYMTDVSGLFVIVLCLYLCLRAVDAHNRRAALLWLAAASAGGVLGGTVRQIAWLGALVMVPSTAWLLRKRVRGVLALSAALWAATIAAIIALLHWWNRQPYSVPEHIDHGRVTLTMVHHMFGYLGKAACCLALLVFPTLSIWYARRRFNTRASVLRLLAGIAIVAAVLTLVAQRAGPAWLAPFLTHMLQAEMRGSGEFPGVVQVSWPAWVRGLISVLVLGGVVALVDALIAQRRHTFPPRTDAPTPAQRAAMFWTLVPFSSAYLLLIAPRALYEMIYDRYLIGLMPVAIAYLLCWFTARFGARVPLYSFVAVAVFAAFGIVGTHDWYATNRARLRAVQTVQAAGIRRTSIQGAFELDGWAEVDAAGHINEEKIEYPKGAFKKNMRMYQQPIPCWHFFDWFAPAIVPVYVVTSTRDDCFVDSQFAPVPYTAWMPPFHRQVYIRKVHGAPQ